MNPGYRRDPESGVSERVYDAIRNFERIVDAAVEREAPLVVCAGDFYARSGGVNPTIKRELRKGPLAKLRKHGIAFRIVAGNHDAPSTHKKGSDLEELSAHPNVEVFRRASHEVLDLGGRTVALVYVPYYRTHVLAGHYRCKHPEAGEPESEGEAQTLAAAMITRLIQNKLTLDEVKDADVRVLVSHYALSQAEQSKSKRYALHPSDLRLRLDEVLAEEFDLVVFGHVHKSNDLSGLAGGQTKVIVPGDIDRLDWGEKYEKKGFWTYHVGDRRVQFHELPCRRMVSVRLEIPDDVEDVEGELKKHLPVPKQPGQFDGAEIRVAVVVPSQKGHLIRHDLLEQTYPQAFHTRLQVQVVTSRAGRVSPREDVIDPLHLFEDYVAEENFADDLAKRVLAEGAALFEDVAGNSLGGSGADPVRIERIAMEGFKKYGSRQEVRLDKGTTAIVGPTGSGKTSVFDALAFAIFGTNAIGKPADRAFGKRGGKVEVVFRQGNVRWRVSRGYRRRNGKATHFLHAWFTRPGEPEQKLSGGIKTLERQLKSVLGMNFKGFKNSVFVAQGEIKNFSQTTSESLKVFQRLFHLEVFEELLKAAKQKLRELKEAHAVVRARIQENEVILERRGTSKRLEEQLASLEEHVEAQQRKVQSLEAALGKYEREKERLEPLRKKLDKKYGKLAVIDANIQRTLKKIKTLKSLKEQRERLERERALLGPDPKDEILRLRGEQERLRIELEVATLKEHEIDKIETERTIWIERVVKDLCEAQRELGKVESRIEGVTTELDAEEAFSLLRDEGCFTEATRRIEEVEIPLAERLGEDRTVDEFLQEKRDAEAILRDLKKQTGQINRDCFVLTELRVRREELRGKIRDLKSKKDQLEKQFETLLKEKLRDFDQEKVALKRAQFQEIEERIRILEDLSKKVDYFERLLREKPDPTPQLLETAEEHKRMLSQKKDLETVIAELKEQTEGYDSLVESISNFHAKISLEREELTKLRSRQESVQESLAEARELEETLKKLEADKKRIEGDVEVFEVLANQIFHASCVPQYAINRLTTPLSKHAGELLEELTGGRYTQVKLETVTAKNKFGFEIKVFDAETQEYRPVRDFSGGEQTQINAALRLAISHLLSMQNYSAAKFLFIDEGDLGSLDEDEARNNFVDVLVRMTEDYEQLVLITHFPEVADRFDRSFRVSIVNGESRIERAVDREGNLEA
ncbi:MAG: hypothetical protein Kow0069_09580 [Promethearchaeota archaeon]